MKIAIPLMDGLLSPHFGHSSHVAMIQVNDTDKRIEQEEVLPLPPHAPGVLPRWLAGHQPDLVITGGMGQRAVLMLADAGIRVLAGAPTITARQAVTAYLQDKLTLQANACHQDPNHTCDHEHHEHHEHHHDH